MDDKKNIVIKVKYPTSATNEFDTPSNAKIITQWNIKRIVIFFVGLIFFVGILTYLFKPKSENTVIQPEITVSRNDNKVIETPRATATIPTNTNTNTDTSNSIPVQKELVRSLFTSKVINNEPADSLELPLKFNKNSPTSIYYFAELNAMKDKTIYHEWLLEGKLITRKKVHISDDTWRTSSRQFFSDSLKTHWTVRIVDESGHVLNELPFNVTYE
jgi:hypothetical protein